MAFAAWLSQGGGLASQLLRAAAVMLTGAFTALSLRRPSGGVEQALAAAALAAAALGVWLRQLGVSWAEVQRAVQGEVSSFHRELAGGIGAASAAERQAVLDELSAAATGLVALTPALLVLAAVAGISLAWAWHHRLAERPLGPPPRAFTAFRFSDHLIWLAVGALAVLLAPASPPAAAVARNALVVVAALYAVRGLAVLAASWRGLPAAAVAGVSLVALLFLPLVAAGLTILGVIDTWLDFRRRLPTPTTRGFD